MCEESEVIIGSQHPQAGENDPLLPAIDILGATVGRLRHVDLLPWKIESSYVYWIVYNTKKEETVGVAYLVVDEMDMKAVNLGIVAPKYGSPALKILLDLARWVGLSYIETTIETDNIPAIKLLMGSGFIQGREIKSPHAHVYKLHLV